MTDGKQLTSRHESAVPVVIIVGLPGVGKSTIGRRVASRLGWNFVDLDATIESREGRAIRDIFSVDGEDTFRTIEAEALRRVFECDRPTLVATGGGVVLRQENRERLRGAVAVVWMTASVSDLETRLKPRSGAARGHRPLLDGDVTETLQQLVVQREPLYREVATEILSTTGRTFDDVVDDLTNRIRRTVTLDQVTSHQSPALDLTTSAQSGEGG